MTTTKRLADFRHNRDNFRSVNDALVCFEHSKGEPAS